MPNAECSISHMTIITDMASLNITVSHLYLVVATPSATAAPELCVLQQARGVSSVVVVVVQCAPGLLLSA